MELTERQAIEADKSWLWELYVRLLECSITTQWGWDIVFQRNMFETNLPTICFRIISCRDKDVAAYLVNTELDHYYLKMLLVTKEYQNKGIGRKIMEQLKIRASAEEKPLRLSVIKANPVSGFYLKMGFKVVGEDDESVKMAYVL